MCRLLVVLQATILLFVQVEANTRCVRVHGQVECDTDQHRHEKVRITLLDKDSLPWESDDLMGMTYTDLEGRFTVEGCGDDFGMWNDPDPYIVVDHRCPLQGHTVAITHRKTYVPVQQIFLPLETRTGIIRLDLDQEG